MRKLLLTAVILTCSLAFGQSAPTVSNDIAATENHGIDSVNLQNLSVYLNFPIRSRAGFALSLAGTSDCEDATLTVAGTSVQSSACGIGASTLKPGNGASLLVAKTGTLADFGVVYATTAGSHCLNTSGGTSSATKYSSIVVSDGSGGSHPVLPVTTVIYNADAGQTACQVSSLTYAFTDGSGLTLLLSVTPSVSWQVIASSGTEKDSSTGKMVDDNGDTLYTTNNGTTTTYFDALGASYSPVSYTGNGTSTGRTFTWKDVNGANQSASETLTSKNVGINFLCADNGYRAIATNVLTQLSYTDSSHIGISYEADQNHTGNITGRLGTLTLRTGGTVAYAYPGGPYAMNCFYFVPPTMTRTTPDGTTTYTWATLSSGGHVIGNTTTVLDPGKNKKVYTFTGLTDTGVAPLPTAQVLTQVQTYQNTGTVASPVYTLLGTEVICYNGNATSCASATVSYPITQKDVYRYVGSNTKASRTETQYDSFGNVTYSAQFDFGASIPTRAKGMAYGSHVGSSCNPIGSNINNRPCYIQITDPATGNTLSSVTFTYDANGNLTGTQTATLGGTISSLNTSATYNPNGTVKTATDVNGTITTYTYGDCNGFFPTQAQVKDSSGTILATTSTTAYCDGMVPHMATDANGNQTIYSYTNGTAGDPFWRLLSVTDPAGNVSTRTPGITTDNVTGFSFNATTTLDSLGRVVDGQISNPDAGNYDTVSSQYLFSGTNRVSKGSVPCSTKALGSACPSNYTTTTADPFGRPMTVVDAAGGTVTYNYTQNNVSALAVDTKATLSPAPSGENVKSMQTEVDGLGRVKSACQISSGGTSCGQANSATGYATTFAYSDASGSTTTTATRGVQTRTKTYDAAGRLIYENNPESGAVTYTYDNDSACTLVGSQASSTGDLISSIDANGYKTCRTYDNLHRLTDVVVIKNNACVAPVKRFRYDSSTHALLSSPPSYPTTNLVGRMFEAWTGDCTYPVPADGSTSTTDEWFVYNSLGQETELWESTWHIPGWYHSTVTYAPNGALASIAGVPGYPTVTYGFDGEGRPNTAIEGSTNIVTGVTYNPAGQPTNIAIGAGDSDSYTYDPHTGNLTNYTFTVGATPKTQSGTLTWDTDGTLGTLAITDTFNAGGAQTCTFAYDDLVRLTDDNCGSSIWHQTFSYDQYDNISKTGNPGTSWLPGYDAATNHITLTGATYDADGNLTNDGSGNNYGWFPDNKLQSVNSTDCTIFTSTTGRCVIYDAFGRLAEVGINGTYTEVMYAPAGKVATMSGLTTVQKGYFPLPGGATLNTTGSGGTNRFFWHKDWLGTTRLASNIGSRLFTFDRAFAPYGEIYSTFGGTTDQSFTGDTQDIFPGLFSTPNRELSATQGRWLQPDPARLGWNLYAYGTDPNSGSDPSGLDFQSDDGENGGGSTGGQLSDNCTTDCSITVIFSDGNNTSSVYAGVSSTTTSDITGSIPEPDTSLGSTTYVSSSPAGGMISGSPYAGLGGNYRGPCPVCHASNVDAAANVAQFAVSQIAIAALSIGTGGVLSAIGNAGIPEITTLSIPDPFYTTGYTATFIATEGESSVYTGRYFKSPFTGREFQGAWNKSRHMISESYYWETAGPNGIGTGMDRLSNHNGTLAGTTSNISGVVGGEFVEPNFRVFQHAVLGHVEYQDIIWPEE